MALHEPAIGGSIKLTGLAIAPPTGTVSQAINVSQTGPSTSAGIAGPILYNNIEISHRANVTGSDIRGVGLWFNMFTGGGNQKGIAVAQFVNLNHDTNSSSGGDHIGSVSEAYTTAVDTSGGEIYGANNVAVAKATASGLGLNGLEVDVEIDTGATFTRRTGIRAVNQGAAQASGLDTAYSVLSTTLSGSFQKMFSLSNQFGAFPLVSTADMFYSDASGTIANVFNLANVTISGNILGFTHATLTGAGALSLDGQITSTVATGTAPLVVASATNVPHLNASSLSGATFAAPGAIGGGTAAAGTFTSLAASAGLTLTGASDQLVLNDVVGSTKNIDFQTSGVQRFVLVGAAGTTGDFRIQRYNDSGVFQEYSLLITRATGAVTLSAGNLVLPGIPTADPHVVGQLWSSSGTVHVSAG